jgi:hypothetical protein
MKILAAIMTTGKFWDSRTKACLETWIPKFDNYILCTDTANNDHAYVTTDQMDYNSHKRKQLEGFRICESKYGDYDWFFACSDDNCVNVDNLRYLCETMSRTPAEYILAIYGEGIKCWDKDKNFLYISGGGGHLMNLATLKEFNKYTKEAEDNNVYSSCGDVCFGQIAAKAKIPQISFSLFHSQNLDFYKDDPKRAISYHYIRPEQMKASYKRMSE